MSTKIVYAWFCQDCGLGSRESLDCCPRCQSIEFDYAPSFAQAEIDDEAAERRLREIRANIDPATGCEYTATGMLLRRQAE